MTTTTRTAVISQPMKGVSPEQVARARTRAEQELAARGYVPHDTVYETAFSYEAPQGVVHPAAWHAGAAIQRLAAADALYLAEGWQARAIDLIAASTPGLVIANPRRSQAIPDQGIEAMAQIAWEHRNLATASLIVFWFAAGQVQPIALFELGKALGRGQALVVGADPGYPRLLDVTVQTALERSDQPIHDTLETLVDAAINHPTLITPTTEKGN